MNTVDRAWVRLMKTIKAWKMRREGNCLWFGVVTLIGVVGGGV